MHIATRCSHYARLMRWDKPIGIVLLLWPTLWALWLASTGQPNPFILLIFVLGVICMRSAGCVFNDLLIDILMLMLHVRVLGLLQWVPLVLLKR